MHWFEVIGHFKAELLYLRISIPHILHLVGTLRTLNLDILSNLELWPIIRTRVSIDLSRKETIIHKVGGKKLTAMPSAKPTKIYHRS